MILLIDYLKHLSKEGVRVLPLKENGKDAILAGWNKLATSNKDQIESWFSANKYNAGILTGRENRIIVIDIDPKNGGFESFEIIENEIGPIRKLSNYVVETGSGGFHIYFAYPENVSIKGRINFLPGIDIKSDGGYVVSPYSVHPNGNIYKPLIDHEDKNLYIDYLTTLPEKLIIKLTQNQSITLNNISNSLNSSDLSHSIFQEGSRNNKMFRIASAIRPHLLSVDSIFQALKVENQFRCSPPLNEDELKNISKSVEKYPIKDEPTFPMLKPEAFYGLAGLLASEVAPITGVSREALLFQFLICIGSICGQKFYYSIGGKKIYPSDYMILLGSTGASKKGSSFSDLKWFFDKFYPEFTSLRVKTGINSGEGLINCIRDRVVVKDKDKNGNEIEKVVDEGAISKIVLFLETEFSRLLKAGKRDGSTVTEIYRNAWDQVPLEINTSQRSIRSTNYNVSLIAHCTPIEFKSLISDIDSSNGYLNRFIFCLIGDASPKPFPKSFESIKFSFIVDLINAIETIKAIESEELVLAESAKSFYEEIFNEYHFRNDEFLIELTSRNIQHFLKMAMIFAILDRSSEITIEHLKASKALIDFSEESLRVLYKEKAFSKQESKVIQFLLKNNGISTRGKIQSDCFKNNATKELIDSIQSKLMKHGKIHISQLERGECWSLLTV